MKRPLISLTTTMQTAMARPLAVFMALLMLPFGPCISAQEFDYL